MTSAPAVVLLLISSFGLAAVADPYAAAPPAGPDLFEFVLDRELRSAPDTDRVLARGTFEDLLARCRTEVGGDPEPGPAIAALNRVLLREHLIDYRNSDYWRDARLSTVLVERRGNCWGLSLLYAAVGARLGLPIAVVREPGHALVRWDDGHTVLDVETTDLGTIRRSAGVGPRQVLRSASELRTEILRLELQRWLDAGRREEAVATYAALATEVADQDARRLWQARLDGLQQGAAELAVGAAAAMVERTDAPFPLRAEALRIVANDHYAAERYELADQRLAELTPLVGTSQRAAITARRGRIALRRGNALLAEERARTALLLDPRSVEGALVLGEALIDLGRATDAVEPVRAVHAVYPGDRGVMVTLAACLRLSGQRDAAAILVEDLVPAVEADAVLAFNLAWYHAVVGDGASVVTWLERSRAVAGDTRTTRWLARTPALAAWAERPKADDPGHP